MSTNYKIGVVLDASGFRAATSDIKKADSALNQFGKFSKDIFSSFAGNSIADAFLKITSAAASGGAAVVKYSANLEQTAIGFESILGSGVKAQKMLKDLAAFSKTTPFTFEGLQPIAQRLLGANIEAEKLIPLMRDIGNVTAATGKTSVERLEGIGVAITQIISKGKVSAEEMEQLAERGIPAWNILSQAIGKSVGETRKLAEDGRISADVMVQALSRVAREKYGDAMAKQAETGAGAFTKISDTILQSAATMFDPYYKEAAKIASRTAKEIDKQEGDLFKIGNTIAASITEGLARGILEYDYKGLFDSFYSGMQKDLESRGLVRSLLFSGAIGPGLEQGLNNGLGLKLPDQIKREADEMNKLLETGERLRDELPLKFREGFSPISREGNIIRGLDTVTNTIKEIRLETEKLAPIKLDGVESATKKVKELKYNLSSVLEAMRIGTASQESGGNKRAVNSRTGAAGLFQVLPSNVEDWTRAVFGRSMSVEDFKKDADAQIAVFNKFMGDYLKTALKASGGNWEEAIRRAAAAWYGGLGNMKNFDANFGGKGKEPTFRQYTTSVLNKTKKVLGGGSEEEFDFNSAEQARRIGEKLLEDAKRRNEETVRNREQSDDRILEIARATTSQEQSLYDNMFARRQITESEFAAYSVQTEVELLEKQRDIFEERLQMAELSAADRIELEQKIALLTLGIQQTVIEGQTKAVRAFEDATESLAKELEDFEIEGYEKAVELTERLRDASQDAAEAQFNLQKAILENAAIKPGGNLARVNELAKLEREELLKTLDANRARLKVEKDGELERVKGVQDEAELKAKINEAYRLKELGLEAEYQQRLLEIAAGVKAKTRAAKQADAADNSPFSNTIRTGIQDTTGLASLDESIGKATTDAEARSAAIKNVYQDLGATVVDVFSGIADATQNMLENFILTGEGGAAVFAQLAASIIASLAVQSGVKAIFEVAEGFAAAARYDFVAAAGHFTAAKIYGAVAIGAAAVGVGIGLAGGLQGGKGKGKSQSDQPDYTVAKSSTNANANNQNIVQSNGNFSADPTTRKLVEHIKTLGELVDAVYAKMRMAKAGDILTAGADQRPGFLADRTISELNKDSSKVKKMGKALNLE